MILCFGQNSVSKLQQYFIWKIQVNDDLFDFKYTCPGWILDAWCDHDVEVLSASLALVRCKHQSLVESSHKRPVMQSFDVFVFVSKISEYIFMNHNWNFIKLHTLQISSVPGNWHTQHNWLRWSIYMMKTVSYLSWSKKLLMHILFQVLLLCKLLSLTKMLVC